MRQSLGNQDEPRRGSGVWAVLCFFFSFDTRHIIASLYVYGNGMAEKGKLYNAGKIGTIVGGNVSE